MSSKKLTPAKAARRALLVEYGKRREALRDTDKKLRVDAVKSAETAATSVRKATRAKLALADDKLRATSKQRAADKKALHADLADESTNRKAQLFRELRQAGQARRKQAMEDKQSRQAAFTKLVSEVPNPEGERNA